MTEKSKTAELELTKKEKLERVKKILADADEIIEAVKQKDTLNLKEMIKLCNNQPESLVPFYKARIKTLVNDLNNYAVLIKYLFLTKNDNIQRIILFRMDYLKNNNGVIKIKQRQEKKIEAIREKVTYQ